MCKKVKVDSNLQKKLEDSKRLRNWKIFNLNEDSLKKWWLSFNERREKEINECSFHSKLEFFWKEYNERGYNYCPYCGKELEFSREKLFDKMLKDVEERNNKVRPISFNKLRRCWINRVWNKLIWKEILKFSIFRKDYSRYFNFTMNFQKDWKRRNYKNNWITRVLYF